MLFQVRSVLPVLIGCGCAAASKAIFDALIGGVLFTLEIILLDFSIRFCPGGSGQRDFQCDGTRSWCICIISIPTPMRRFSGSREWSPDDIALLGWGRPTSFCWA